MFVSPHNIYFEFPTISAVIFRDGASKEAIMVKWGHMDRASSDRINVLTRGETGGFSLSLCRHKGEVM